MEFEPGRALIPIVIMKTKICTKCKNEKTENSFYKSKVHKDGLYPYCKSCATEYKRNEYKKWSVEQRRKARESRTPEQRRKYSLKQLYGLTVADYKELWEYQEGKCAICGGVNKSGKELFVDHNHQTGKIRGLLCMHCNHAIGKFNDDINLLQRAIEYLEINDG